MAQSTLNQPSLEDQFFDTRQFQNQTSFGNHALDAVCAARCHRDAIYTEVSEGWGKAVVAFLNSTVGNRVRKHYNSLTRTFWMRIMPTDIHDCHLGWVVEEKARWVRDGLLTDDEGVSLELWAGNTFDFFRPPYEGSRIEPDLMFRLHNHRLPGVVMQSGWIEAASRLHEDMKLWLVGGRNFIKAVIILKWQRTENSREVAGTVELFTLDGNGIPFLQQEEPILPAPPSQQARAQAIRLTRRMLFGSALPEGRNPDDVFDLRLDCLRKEAADSLVLMHA